MEEENVQSAENAQNEMVDLEETPVEEQAAAKVPLPPAKPKEPRIAPPSSLQEIIGALLFASESPLTATDLRECVRGVEPEEGESSEVMDVYHTCTSREIEQAIHGLEKELERSGCGFRLVCAGGAYRLQTVPTCGRYVRALLHLDRPNRLSRAALETLAIIAYRQPITKAEIEQIRGVAVDTIVKTLVDLQLVRLVGRSELPGHPFLYGTTPLFLEHFGLASLGELNAIDPTLQRSNPRERAKLFQKKEKSADQPDLPDQSQVAEEAKAEAGEKHFGSERLAQTLDCEHFTAAPDTGSELEMHIVAKRKRLIDHLHFAQHLLAALSPLDGFFAVELSEFGDDLFLMPDLGLIIEPGSALLLPQCFLFFRVSRVVSGEDSRGGILNLNDPGDSPVQKIAVVGDNDHSSPVVGQIGLKPADTSQIQMVCRLIQHNHIRPLQKEPGKSDAGFLAARKSGDLFIKLTVRETQSAQNTHDLAFIGIAVHHLKAVEQCCIGLDQFIERIAFDTFHFLFISGQLLLHLDDLALGFQGLIVDRAGRIQALVLGKVAQSGSGRQSNASVVSLHFPCHDAQKSGLAGSVDPDNSRPVAFLKVKSNIGQHDFLCKFL